MAEHQSVEGLTVAPAAQALPAPEAAEKPWLLGQTPSMWFLIDSAVVLLIVVIMRLVS